MFGVNSYEKTLIDADGVHSKLILRDAVPLCVASRRAFTVKQKAEKASRELASRLAMQVIFDELQSQRWNAREMQRLDSETRAADAWIKGQLLIAAATEGDSSLTRVTVPTVSVVSDNLGPGEARYHSFEAHAHQQPPQPRHRSGLKRRTDVEAQRLNAVAQNARRSALRKANNAEAAVVQADSVARQGASSSSQQPNGVPVLEAVAEWWRKKRQAPNDIGAVSAKRYRLNCKTADSTPTV